MLDIAREINELRVVMNTMEKYLLDPTLQSRKSDSIMNKSVVFKLQNKRLSFFFFSGKFFVLILYNHTHSIHWTVYM